MKKTKLLGGILAATMLASVMPVNAATNAAGSYVMTSGRYMPDSWEVVYNEGKVKNNAEVSLTWTDDEKDNNYWTTYKVAEDMVDDSGSASMLMYARDWTKDNTDSRFMEVRGKLKETAPVGKYRLTVDIAEGKVKQGTSIWQTTASANVDSNRTGFYYQLGNVSTGSFKQSVAWDKVNGGLTKDNSYAKNSASGAAWRRFTADITTTSDSDTIRFLNLKSENNILDNIKLQAITDDGEGNVTLGENLVVNGDFENSINAATYVPTELYESNTWKYLKIKDRVTCTDEEWLARNYAGVTPQIGRNGGSSLFMHFEDTLADNTYVGYQNIATQSMALEQGVKYGYELWVKGAFDKDFCIYPQTYGAATKRLTFFTKGETDDEGWTRYYTTVTPTEAKAAVNFTIIAQQAGTNVFVDDVKFYKTSDPDVNLITDGGFENNKVIDTKTLINPIVYSVKGGSAATTAYCLKI